MKRTTFYLFEYPANGPKIIHGDWNLTPLFSPDHYDRQILKEIARLPPEGITLHVTEEDVRVDQVIELLHKVP